MKIMKFFVVELVLFTWVVFLKQSYFIFDVIMVDQNAKK